MPAHYYIIITFIPRNIFTKWTQGAISLFEGSGPAITAHGSLDLKQEIQIQNENESVPETLVGMSWLVC
jgi:hypothetical protein